MTTPNPNKLHELLGQAIKDIQLVKKDDRYSIDFYVLHAQSPFHGEVRESSAPCKVCLAGAWLANTKKAPRTKEFWLQAGHFPTNTKLKDLLALDNLRLGRVAEACKIFYSLERYKKEINKELSKKRKPFIPFYGQPTKDDWKAFIAQCKRMHKMLVKLDI
jgi:hypothetical protein